MVKSLGGAKPGVVIFLLILAGMVVVGTIFYLGPETSMVSLPGKYIYCPGPVRYLAGNPDARERDAFP